jgi:hypothetical protein
MKKLNTLSGTNWKDYINKHDMKKIPYLELYSCTHKYVQIFKIKDYYFTMWIFKWYKHLPSLKRQIY